VNPRQRVTSRATLEPAAKPVIRERRAATPAFPARNRVTSLQAALVTVECGRLELRGSHGKTLSSRSLTTLDWAAPRELTIHVSRPFGPEGETNERSLLVPSVFENSGDVGVRLGSNVVGYELSLQILGHLLRVAGVERKCR
jgi:hypothetical protein